jgi:hypothetical protein
LELGTLGPSRHRQDMANPAVLSPRWLPDPYPDSEELVAPQPRLDALQAIVAGEATALLHPDDARRQVELVMDYDQAARKVIDIEAPDEAGDGTARFVHVGLRKRQRQALPVHPHLGLERKFLPAAQVPAMALGQERDDIGPDVVAGLLVLVPRVAEADRQQVDAGRSRRFAAPNQAGSGLLGVGRLGSLAALAFGAHCRGSFRRPGHRCDHDGLVRVDVSGDAFG